MEEIAAILITILISSGILGGAYIYFKDKLKYAAEVVYHISGVLTYLYEALEDDKLTEEEVKQIVRRLEDLIELLRQILGGK